MFFFFLFFSPPRSPPPPPSSSLNKMSGAAEPNAVVPPWWWTHDSLEDAATPLDPTADDVAADCLTAIALQTAQHTVAHRELLRQYIFSSQRDEAAVSATATTPAAVAAAEVYAALKWHAVLPALLGQLRKAMMRAWEERAAEQAEAAVAVVEGANPLHESSQSHLSSSIAVSSHISSPFSPSLPSSAQEATTTTAATAAAAACADPVLLRRLRMLQQQVYVAFLKAVLQGLANGAQAAVLLLEKEGAESQTRAEEGQAHQVDTSAATARVVALLLDGLLARLMEAATMVASAPAASTLQEEAPKTHRDHHAGSSPSAAHLGSAVNDWFTGMMPLYLRAAQRNAQVAASAAANGKEEEKKEEVNSAPTRSFIPSPALCIVSYVGVFVQDAGLHLLASEQAAQLPLFTSVVHRVFLADVQRRCEAALTCASSSSSYVSLADAAAAHVESASAFLQHLTNAQLYSEGHGAELEDDDCTAWFHAPPAVPPLLMASTKAAGGIVAAANSGEGVQVDYSVASLLALTTYSVCSLVLSQLERWWTACRQLLWQAHSAALPSTDNDRSAQQEHKKGEEGEETGDEATKQKQATQAQRDDGSLKKAVEAWLVLRRQALTASTVLGQYAETTLLQVPYAALLTRLFYATTVKQDLEKGDLSAKAWKACLRELHSATRAVYSHSCSSSSRKDSTATHVASTTTAAAVSDASSRPFRQHFRNAGHLSFPTASLLRVPTVLSEAAVRGFLPSVEGTDAHQPTSSADVTPKVLPLAFSLLHQPLAVLQDRVLLMLMAPTAVVNQQRVDSVVGEKGSVADKPAATSPDAGSIPPSSQAVAASVTSARARAASDQPMSAPQIVELSFPRHYGLFHAMDLAMQYAVLRSQELADAAADATANAWVASSVVPALFGEFFGAALDEAFVMRMRTSADEVSGSEMLMFFAAVFRTLSEDTLPCLRATLVTFLGHAGAGLLPYIRYGIVDQQRYGLATFFLPPLRALGLDYSTVEETDISLALGGKPTYAAAMAYAWELPRLFFWRHDATPVAEVAWHAHSAAQQYLCELMTQVSPEHSAFMDILLEAGAVAHQRSSNSSNVSKGARSATARACGGPHVQAVAIDAMTAVFLGICRWCGAQLATASPAFPRETIRTALTALCAPHAAPHPYLRRLQAQLRDATGVNGDGEGAERKTETTACAARVADWIWACSYDAAAPAHLQACAKHLLRDFSAQFGQRAPIKTVLGIRAMVEQKMKVEEAVEAAATLQGLARAVRDDVAALLAMQQKKEQEAFAKAEADKKKAAAAATQAEEEPKGRTQESPENNNNNNNNEKEEEMQKQAAAVPSSSTSAVEEAAKQQDEDVARNAASAAPPPLARWLASAELRRYVDQLLHALVARARLSVVDGAVSAVALAHVIRALSDPQLPLRMSPQDRQRMCERFVFTLTSSMPDLTRVEAASCACSLRLVLDNIVLPFKKSFLEKTASLRMFHGCLSDSEADAFKMVQHTLGDIVTAFQKCQPDTGSVSILNDWRALLLIEHTGSSISLVRSLLEKTRVTIRKTVLRRKGGASVEALHEQLLRMEKEAAHNDRGVADDVLHLFTHNPPPPPSLPASPASAAIAEMATNGRDENNNNSTSSRTRRRRSRERSRRTRSSAVVSLSPEVPRAEEEEEASDEPRRDGRRRKRDGRRLRGNLESRKAPMMATAQSTSSRNNRNNNGGNSGRSTKFAEEQRRRDDGRDREGGEGSRSVRKREREGDSAGRNDERRRRRRSERGRSGRSDRRRH